MNTTETATDLRKAFDQATKNIKKAEKLGLWSQAQQIRRERKRIAAKLEAL